MQAIQSYESPAKLILLGEHFVIFGAPALAVPLLDLTTRVTLRQVNAPGAHLGELSWAPATDPHPRHLEAKQRRQARGLLEHAITRVAPNSTSGFLLEAHSSIPLGYGLGSSAAFAVGVTVTLHALLNLHPDASTLSHHAHALEKMVHGNPSGIDEAVVLKGLPLSLRKGEATKLLKLSSPLSLVLASAGSPGSTREAVARVAALREHAPERFASLVAKADALGEAGIAACATGNLCALGALLDRAHALLQKVGVCPPRLDDLVQKARQAGALGAKITGAGLGGFMVALVPPERVERVRAALVASEGELVFSTVVPATTGKT
ncbi:MAG: mevalonate kinase [Deltaproteobacteria bacterium]|nr:mevalonate kinase [Deltaproteobacteria bacterium]